MNNWLLIVTALSAGFFGSPHCLGMCGGIVSALGFALHSQTPARRLWLQLLYHAGRLSSYTLLGLLVGALGQGILAPLRDSRWPYVVTALMMVVFGLYLSGWWRGLDKLEALGGQLWQAMAPLRQRLLPVNSMPRALLAGMLWGFLPCGLVYSALALALSSGQAVTSGLVMLAFGIGTLPMMLMAGSAAAELKQKLQQQGWRTANGLLVMAFGVWTLVQALTHHGAHAGHQHHMPMPEASAPATADLPANQGAAPTPPAAATDTVDPHAHHHHHADHDMADMPGM